MAENTKSPRRAKKDTAAAKPTASAAETAGAAAAQADALANATDKANPASTTSAADPARDAEAAAAAAAAASGTNDAGNTGKVAGEGEVIPPASAEKPLEDAAAGNRHSHPAETTAEATLRASERQDTTAALNMGGNLPAGEFADPNGPAGRTDGGEGANADNVAEVRESTQKEDGSVQDAVRAAIGAGTGAPDGVGDVGDDPSAAEVVEPVEVAPGVTFEGGKAKLWRALEKGGTHDELAAEAGHRSILGSIYLMARHAGRDIEVAKDKKTGLKRYSLKAVKAAKKSKE
jgi:hypothetical protein